MSKPVILFSSIEGRYHNGDAPYNGGYKSHELWGQALRDMGYEAYRVTRDGTLIKWMERHGPVISLDEAAHMIARNNVRPVTTWMGADEWFSVCNDKVYWYDQELGHSAYGGHLSRLKKRIAVLPNFATHSRTIQAWYMAQFGYRPVYIPEWSDTDIFYPASDRRIPDRIGYMNEGAHTANDICLINERCRKAGYEPQFIEIRGAEAQVRDLMQTCDIFLGLNAGKSPLFGEGCPRSPQEAMHCGAIVIAYDVLGNREYILDGYNGILVPAKRPDLMAGALLNLVSNPDKETIRRRSIDVAQGAFCFNTPRRRAIEEFLHL